MNAGQDGFRSTSSQQECGRKQPLPLTALINQAHRLPDELVKSLTWDRGKEMAQHKRFTLATDAAVYFCDPQSPWQRGGSAAPTRTPTVCCGSTSLRART